jgi:hypothetical protein
MPGEAVFLVALVDFLLEFMPLCYPFHLREGWTWALTAKEYKMSEMLSCHWFN